MFFSPSDCTFVILPPTTYVESVRVGVKFEIVPLVPYLHRNATSEQAAPPPPSPLPAIEFGFSVIAGCLRRKRITLRRWQMSRKSPKIV